MGMQDDQPTNTPPRSLVDPDEYPRNPESINGTHTPQQLFSPKARSRISDTLLEPPPARNSYKSPSHIEEIDEQDDANSNVQVGMRSELGDMPIVSENPFVFLAY